MRGPAFADMDNIGPGPSVDKGKAKVFVAEPRLCFPNRLGTVKDSAILAISAYARIKVIVLADGVRFSELEFKRMQEPRKAKATKKERKAKIKEKNALIADLLEVQAARGKNLLRLKFPFKNKPPTLAKPKSALIDERNDGYNDALNDCASEMSKLKDLIYQGGYKLGFERAGLPLDHELFGRTTLFPPELYNAKVSFDSKENDDRPPASPPLKVYNLRHKSIFVYFAGRRTFSLCTLA
ncbi:hypothetical protein LguiB_027819 [Lonicera macranthoides]